MPEKKIGKNVRPTSYSSRWAFGMVPGSCGVSAMTQMHANRFLEIADDVKLHSIAVASR